MNLHEMLKYFEDKFEYFSSVQYILTDDDDDFNWLFLQ